MTTIAATRDSIVTALRSELPQLRSVETFGGRFTIEEIKRYALQTPCALVAPIGITRLQRVATRRVATVRWAVFVVTKHAAASKCDEQALALVEAISGFVLVQRWSDTAGPAQAVSAENLFSTGIDRHHVALWAVSWQQDEDIEGVSALNLSPFAEASIETTSDSGAEINSLVEMEQ